MRGMINELIITTKLVIIRRQFDFFSQNTRKLYNVKMDYHSENEEYTNKI